MSQKASGIQSEVQSPLAWLKWIVVLLIIMYSGYMVVNMYLRGDVAFPLLIVVLVASGVIIFLSKRTYAHRYAYPAIAGMVTFIVFPMAYTISIAFTNYSGDHTLTQDRAMQFHLQKYYRIPEDQEGGGSYLFKLVAKKKSPNSESKIRQAQLFLQKNDDSKAMFMSDFFELKPADELKNLVSIPTQNVNLSKWDGPNGNKCKEEDGTDIPFDTCMSKTEDLAEAKDINVTYKIALDHVSLVLPDSSIHLQKTKFREFEAVINKYDQVKFGATLPGGRFISDKNLLKDNETSKYFAPDTEAGYYRYLDDEGHPVGENFVPGFKVNVGFKNFGQIIKARSHAFQTFLVQLCPGGGGYLPSPEAERLGGYGGMIVNGNCGSDGGYKLADTAVAKINELFD